MITAEITTVKIGHASIEGLMWVENGKLVFGVAVPQIAKQFAWFQGFQNQASKLIKRLMGEGFKTSKIKTKFNRNSTLCLDLDSYLAVVKVLAKEKKQEDALEFLLDLSGLSLYQLFCDAFHQEITAQDRQDWLLERKVGKAVRRTLTDAIQDYILARPELSETYKTWIYSNVSVEVCKAIYGCKPSALAKHREIDPKKLRDSMSAKELQLVQDVERLTMRLIDEDLLEPMIAVKEAIGRLSIKRQPV